MFTNKILFVIPFTLLSLGSIGQTSAEPLTHMRCTPDPFRGQKNCTFVTDTELLAAIGNRADAHAAQQQQNFDRLISAINANTAATNALVKEMNATITSTNNAHMAALQTAIITRIEALPNSIAGNGEIYAQLRQNLIEDMRRLFELTPK